MTRSIRRWASRQAWGESAEESVGADDCHGDDGTVCVEGEAGGASLGDAESPAFYKHKALPERGGMEEKSLLIARIEECDFCQDDISHCWDYT
jgi:hypothetical protein